MSNRLVPSEFWRHKDLEITFFLLLLVSLHTLCTRTHTNVYVCR